MKVGLDFIFSINFLRFSPTPAILLSLISKYLSNLNCDRYAGSEVRLQRGTDKYIILSFNDSDGNCCMWSPKNKDVAFKCVTSSPSLDSSDFRQDLSS